MTGLSNYQEYWPVRSIIGSIPTGWRGWALGGYDPWDFFAGQRIIGLALLGPTRTSHKVPDPNMGGAGIPFKFIGGVAHPSGLWFSTLDPNTIETDGDTMDDFTRRPRA
jgi:hypothetical protein